jgi:hypothetical protein
MECTSAARWHANEGRGGDRPSLAAWPAGRLQRAMYSIMRAGPAHYLGLPLRAHLWAPTGRRQKQLAACGWSKSFLTRRAVALLFHNARALTTIYHAELYQTLLTNQGILCGCAFRMLYRCFFLSLLIQTYMHTTRNNFVKPK